MRTKKIGAVEQYRQGDILFRRMPKPQGECRIRRDGIILHGEATGHKHALADLDTGEVFECGDGLYVSVTADGGVRILHEEHGQLILPQLPVESCYEVVRQREYSPEEIRNVTD